MTEDELSNSLASWVPPWQRVSAAKPPLEPDKDHDNADQRPESDRVDDGSRNDASAPLGDPSDDDDEDEQRPETDVRAVWSDDQRINALAHPDEDSRRVSEAIVEPFDAPISAAPGDDEDDEQRPETDLSDAEWSAARAPDDDEDDEQRPETDLSDAEWSAARAPDDDEDDEQRPETDLTGDAESPDTHASSAAQHEDEIDVLAAHVADASDSRLSTIIGGDDVDDFDYQESQFGHTADNDHHHHASSDGHAHHAGDHAGSEGSASSGDHARSGDRAGLVDHASGGGDAGSAAHVQAAESRSTILTDLPITPLLVDALTDRPENLAAALEAILLVVDEPVSDDLLAEVVDVPVAEVTDALIALAASYAEQGRGFDLRRAAGGWRFYTRGEYSSYVERFVLDGQSVRLTQAALETLAVIAYQQPVTRSRMAAIRGVSCDGVVRTLTTRGLIEECGTQPDSGAFLYRTTPLFLEKLGLDSLDELPPLAPFLPDDVNGFADV